MNAFLLFLALVVSVALIVAVVQGKRALIAGRNKLRIYRYERAVRKARERREDVMRYRDGD